VAIDKVTFLMFLNVPGMLGERLFAMFDRKKNGMIDFDEVLPFSDINSPQRVRASKEVMQSQRLHRF